MADNACASHISLHTLQSGNFTQTSPYQGKNSFMFLIIKCVLKTNLKHIYLFNFKKFDDTIQKDIPEQVKHTQ